MSYSSLASESTICLGAEHGGNPMTSYKTIRLEETEGGVWSGRLVGELAEAPGL